MGQACNELGVQRRSEGVESAPQAKFLQGRGCSEMQGFYFYKPMSVQEYERTVEENENNEAHPRA